MNMNTWTECQHLLMLFLTGITFYICILFPIIWVLCEDALINGVDVYNMYITSIIMTCFGFIVMTWIVHVSKHIWKEHAWSFIPSIIATNCTLLMFISSMGLSDPHVRLLLVHLPVESIDNSVLIYTHTYCPKVLCVCVAVSLSVSVYMIHTSEPSLPLSHKIMFSIGLAIMYMYMSLLAGICLMFMCICDEAPHFPSGGGGVESGDFSGTATAPKVVVYKEML